MLEIKVLTDKQKIDELLSRVGAEPAENRGVMAAVDRDEVLSFSVFSLNADSMTIEYIVPEDDIPLADGMLRSTIHVGLTRGKNEVFYADTVSLKLLETLRFIKDPERKLLNSDKLFQSCCDCK